MSGYPLTLLLTLINQAKTTQVEYKEYIESIVDISKFDGLYTTGDVYADLRSFLVMNLQARLCDSIQDKKVAEKIKSMPPPDLRLPLPPTEKLKNKVLMSCIRVAKWLVPGSMEVSNC